MTQNIEKLKERLTELIPIKDQDLKAAILDLMLKAYHLDREEPLTDGWLPFEYGSSPYTGEYEVKDSDGNVFKSVYVDFGEDCGWDCDKYIVAYRYLPPAPGKEVEV